MPYLILRLRNVIPNKRHVCAMTSAPQSNTDGSALLLLYLLLEEKVSVKAALSYSRV